MKKIGFSTALTFTVLLLAFFVSFTGCQREQTPPPAATPSAPAPTMQPVTPPPAGTVQPGTAQSGTTVDPAQAVNQVQMGMTTDQVQKIMGAPTQSKPKGTKLEWEYLTPQGKVEIEFQNNQVAAIKRH